MLRSTETKSLEGSMKNFAVVMALLLAPGVSQAGEILRFKATGSLKPMVNLIADSQEETGLYVVQWKSAVHESEKTALRALGLEIVTYVPDDAFLVKGDLASANQAQSLEFVRTVVPFEAGYKMEPELSRAGIFSFGDRAQVSVQLVAGATVPAALASFRDLGEGLFVGEAAVSDLWSLAQSPSVLWVERYLPMTSMAFGTNDSELSSMATAAGAPTGFESGAKVMNAQAAWAAGFNGAGQIVGFADTGLDSGNLSSLIPDFQGQVKVGMAMGLGGNSWGDPHNHGTHVAGSIAGNGRSSPEAAMRGAGFGAQLVAQGMWSDIFNNIVPPGIPKLFDAAYNAGARIHSNSWGAPNSNGRYDNFAVQADTFMFQKQDFLAVFAAGNDGSDMNGDGMIDEGSVSSPGSAKNVLTVGASKNYLLEGGIQRTMREMRDGTSKWGAEPVASSKLSEDPRGMAAFSSRGPAADGRLKPEIVAPGTNIVSARSRHPAAKPEASWGVYDDNYLFMGGTSMATPLTSGAMAIVRQYLLQKVGGSTVSAALLKATVANTAEDLFPGQFGERARGQEQPTRRPNNHEGWGRVNLETLVNLASFHVVDNTKGLATGGQAVLEVRAEAGTPLKVTMAYTDAPATASATRTLVNDLDLTVVTPDGRTLFPNGKASKDNVNNMEQIDVLEPVSGTYKVIVNGANVPQGLNGAQPYALVVTGGR